LILKELQTLCGTFCSTKKDENNSCFSGELWYNIAKKERENNTMKETLIDLLGLIIILAIGLGAIFLTAALPTI